MTIIQPKNIKHVGRCISGVRKLRGISEEELAISLGISAKEVSILEQLDSIDISRIKEIAFALGVTEQGLIDFFEDKTQNNTINFYENCGVKTNTIANYYHHTVNNSEYEKISEALENILKKIDSIPNLKG